MSNVRHPAPDAGSKKKVKIKEIFASIQGEGPYVGYKQLFIRFCGCNLKCNYCDTEFSDKSGYREFSALELAKEVSKYSDIHSISLTGGEPLLSTEFLKEFLPLVCGNPLLQHFSVGEGAVVGEAQTSRTNSSLSLKGRGVKPKIYLETNATLADKFLEIKPYIDIVSADIKLESATGLNTFELHDKFFEACRGVETFAKIVFNSNITDEEIQKSCELGRKYGIELILQPEMLNAAKQLESQAAKFNEEQKAEGQEGKLFNESSLNKISQQQQTDKNPSTDKDLFAYSHIRLLTVNPDFAEQILDQFLQNYDKVRLIPQVHKFLNVR